MHTSSCSHDREDIVLLHYGELPEDRVADVQARLSVCASCRDVLSGLEAVADAVPRQPTVHIEKDALDAIRRSTAGRLRRLEQSEGSEVPGFWSGLLLRPSLAGGAVAVLVVVAFLAGMLV